MNPNHTRILAQCVGLPPIAIESVMAFGRRLESDAHMNATFATLARALSDGLPETGIAALRSPAHYAHFDCKSKHQLFLQLALSQVPEATRRALANGRDQLITRQTLADLAVWARYHFEHWGTWGLSMEMLEWAQHYLCGTLVRLGAMQFEREVFYTSMWVYRHRETLQLAARYERDGALWDVDLELGELRGQSDPLNGEQWSPVLVPGDPVIATHIPSDSRITAAGASASVRAGFAYFSTASAEEAPVAACGEAWLFDPQVRTFLPRNRGIHMIQSGVHLYPSSISEESTIRRLFGPAITRSHLSRLPAGQLNTLQRAIVNHLSDSTATLRGRGAFFLRDELENLGAYT